MIPTPRIDPTAFIAPSAMVMGEVTLEAESSVWYTSVLRGDMAPIHIGSQTCIQDGTIVHVDAGVPCTIGPRVGVGHKVILHGCTVGAGCLIGMGATILNHAVIGEGSIVGAGALVTEKKEFPPNSLIVGSPARMVRTLGPEVATMLNASADLYAAKAAHYASDLKPL